MKKFLMVILCLLCMIGCSDVDLNEDLDSKVDVNK